jgi:hypothetical protein
MSDDFYLSVVVAARNDNYGGDFDLRFQNCIKWFDYYANKYKLRCEFVIVNYNPLVHKTPLSELVNIDKNSLVKYRFINVPESFHQKLLQQSKRIKLPFLEYAAKNIGIKRATGEFILCINPDILIAPEIFQQLAKKNLHKHSYYRADRCDFHYDGKAVTPESDLEKIRSEVFRVFKKGRIYDLPEKGITSEKLQQLEKQNSRYLKWNLFLPKISWLANRFSIPVIYDNVVFKFHGNHGDFTLMHHEQWNKLRAHPENLPHPMHTDAFTICVAKSAGLNEEVFAQPAYHAEHNRQFIADNSNPDIRKAYDFFVTSATKMLAEKKPMILNDESWGFANETFEETTLN